MISGAKKTRFCTKNGPSRRPPIGFFTFSPNFSRQSHCRQRPSSPAKAGHFPAENGHFPPRPASGRRGFFWFFCGKKGSGPPQKIRRRGPRRFAQLYISQIPYCVTHYRRPPQKNTFSEQQECRDVTMSACRRHRRLLLGLRSGAGGLQSMRAGTCNHGSHGLHGYQKCVTTMMDQVGACWCHLIRVIGAAFVHGLRPLSRGLTSGPF